MYFDECLHNLNLRFGKRQHPVCTLRSQICDWFVFLSEYYLFCFYPNIFVNINFKSYIHKLWTLVSWWCFGLPWSLVNITSILQIQFCKGNANALLSINYISVTESAAKHCLNHRYSLQVSFVLTMSYYMDISISKQELLQKRIARHEISRVWFW